MCLLHLFAEFWQVVGGRTLAEDDTIVPPYQSGHDWPVLRPAVITNQWVFEMAKTLGHTCWSKWSDLNVLEVKEPYLQAIDRRPLVFIRLSVEPDTRLSYNQAVEKQIPFISIGQRIALTAFFWWVHRDHQDLAVKLNLPLHLDSIGYTRTSSLAPDGDVAGAYWRGDARRFRVHWRYRGDTDPDGGIREASA